MVDRLYDVNDKVIVKGDSSYKVFRIIGVREKRGSKIIYACKSQMENLSDHYQDLEQDNLIKLKEDEEGYIAVDDTLIHYFDNEFNYETSKMK